MNRSFSRGLGKRLQPGKLRKIFYFIKYVNKKGFKTSKKVLKPLFAFENFDFPIVGSKIKVVAESSMTY